LDFEPLVSFAFVPVYIVAIALPVCPAFAPAFAASCSLLCVGLGWCHREWVSSTKLEAAGVGSEGDEFISRLFSHRITESQNGRGWKGPLWVTQSNPLPKQGHLQ